jgi:hypothetical protein
MLSVDQPLEAVQLKRFFWLIIISLILVLQAGCATMQRAVPFQELTLNDAENLVSAIQAKENSIQSFYSLGIVSIKGWLLDSDADFLIAGIKSPLSIKIEITHSWGMPVLYVLIKEGRLEVLSFQDKILYAGEFTPEALSRFLPGLYLDQQRLWPILCGRPPVLKHDSLSIPKPGMIALSDSGGTEVEIIYAAIKSDMPSKIIFPEQNLNISFSNVKTESGIFYASEIRVAGDMLKKDLALKTKKILFNASIPDQIFRLEKPSGYGIVDLDNLEK